MGNKGRREFPLLKEGVVFVAPLLGISIFFGWRGDLYLLIPSSLLTLFTMLFFRNPPREITEEEGAILSPADGRVIAVTEGVTFPFTGEEGRRVSIFMSVFNCHVNRAPVGGVVERVEHRSGRFLPAYKGMASQQNEQNLLSLRRPDGMRVVTVQVAGVLARRIICRLRPGERVEKGEVFGAILLGSRVDLYLPLQVRPLVKEGERVKAGQSIVGRVR